MISPHRGKAWLEPTQDVPVLIDFASGAGTKRLQKLHTACQSNPLTGTLDYPQRIMPSDLDKLLKKNQQLNQLDSVKVLSHVQRESGKWVLNTLMLQGYDVPFKYNRTKLYKSLEGAPVNLTYYPQTELIAGLEFESMKVVRIRRS